MWDCWAVVVGILPLVCSDNDVGVVGLVLSTVALISSPLLWGNLLEAQGATTLRESVNHLDGEVNMHVADWQVRLAQVQVASRGHNDSLH